MTTIFLPSPDQTEKVAMHELQKAAYHEAGHKIIYELFGGAGDAVVWKSQSEDPDEVAWLGQFRARICAEKMHEIWTCAGLNVPPLPSNWRVMYGMAGLIAEQILRGEKNFELIAGALDLRICCDEVSATDLEAMGVTDIGDFEVDVESVEQCAQHLLERWSSVTQEAEHLIAIASTRDTAFHA
jgi:hypothetical protein